jgi:RNA polymerase sigma-70 factor (ECF subfamily)
MQLAWRSQLDASSDETGADADASGVVETQSRDDLAIVRLAQADLRAFAPLYDHYGPIVYHYCLRRLSHPEIAADAASTVFAKVIAGLPKFRPDPRRSGSTFRAWLFTIAHNVVIDVRRRDRHHVSLDANADTLAGSPNLIDPGTSPEDLAIVAESSLRLRELFDLLPERQRAVLELRLAGLSGSEISQTLGVSESAVKSIQFRAYTTLRDALRQANIHSSESLQ